MKLSNELTDRQYYSITRKIKKIKLKEIAQELNCSVPLLSMYELGRTGMNDNHISKYKQIIDNK